MSSTHGKSIIFLAIFSISSIHAQIASPAQSGSDINSPDAGTFEGQLSSSQLLTDPVITNLNIGQYITAINAAQNYAGGENSFDDLGVEGITQAMRQGAQLNISLEQVSQINRQVDKINQNFRSQTPTSFTADDIKAIFPYLETPQANALANEINTENSGATGESGVLLAAIIMKQQNIQVLSAKQFAELLNKNANRPINPHSPTMQSINRITARTMHSLSTRRPKSSGDFWSNGYAMLDYSYTDYEDKSLDNEGDIHYQALSLGGTIADNLDLSFAFYHDDLNQTGTDELDSETFGGDFNINYNLNDNYAIGVLGFFQQSDVEFVDPASQAYGGGFLFSTYHIFNNFDFSSVHSLAYSHTDYEYDAIYVGYLHLGYQWSDKLNTGLSYSFVDSLRNHDDYDSTYAAYGADISYLLTDSLTISSSLETIQHLDDYSSEIIYVSLQWDF